MDFGGGGGGKGGRCVKNMNEDVDHFRSREDEVVKGEMRRVPGSREGAGIVKGKRRENLQCAWIYV